MWSIHRQMPQLHDYSGASVDVVYVTGRDRIVQERRNCQLITSYTQTCLGVSVLKGIIRS